MKNVLRSRSFGTWSSTRTLKNFRASSTMPVVSWWVQMLVELLIVLISSSVHVKSIARSKARCLLRRNSNSGPSFMETVTVRLPPSLRRHWRSVLTLAVMIKQNPSWSRWNQVWSLKTGPRYSKPSSLKVCRWSFCYCLVRKVSARSMMMWRNSFSLSSQSRLKSFSLVQSQKARIFGPLLARFSFRWTQKLEEFHGQSTIYHLCLNQLWFVVWTSSTARHLARSQSLLLQPQWISQQPHTGQRVLCRTRLVKKDPQLCKMVLSKLWKASSVIMVPTQLESSSTETV